MKKILIVFMLFSFFGQACKKELSHNVKQEDQPRIQVELEGEEGNESADDPENLANTEKNEHSVYSFGGVAGLYYGCSSSFRISEKTSIEIVFGTSLTTNLNWSIAEFEQLVRPGERTFGSLGSFSSFPQLLADKVEIAYTDRKSRRWCSTKIIEKDTDDGIQCAVRIEQPEGKFTISEVKKADIDSDGDAYRIRGQFECILYEVGGDAKKKIKARFTGIVSPK